MSHVIWLVFALPLAGFLVLALAGRRLGRRAVAAVGVTSVAAAAVVSIALAFVYVAQQPPTHAYGETLWSWMTGGGLDVGLGLRLDPLAIVMILVVSVVGALIHLYSAEFMADDPGYSRFFAYMNLFVAAMLILVLADNLVLLYLGWEGVGLCSYLLIGFWYDDPANSRAAQKAFIVTRIGDAALAVGLFLIFRDLGTLSIQELMTGARVTWPVGSASANWAAALILGGAVGKSAQIPLQTWLPDAMAGPTPVSALIHAATMVTAGVYLIARTHVLFALAPDVLLAVGIVGAATMLVASFAALSQTDIKRVLAYSTISQIGLMFLALGVGAWSAAIFHLFTHAFFKALLFLAAGAVIHAAHHEHDIRKLGGLRHELPVAYWSFVIGGASLSALPLVTAGFYSKELILWQAYVSQSDAGRWLWGAGVAGAFLTALYTFRLVFIVFHGEQKTHVERHPGGVMNGPLVALCVGALVAGFFEMPGDLGGLDVFSSFLAPILPQPPSVHLGLWAELWLQLVASALAVVGVWLAWRWFSRRPRSRPEAYEVPLTGGAVGSFFLSGLGFDALYRAVFIRPFLALARASRGEPLDLPYRAIAFLMEVVNDALARTQTGRLRWYAGILGAGAALILLAGVLA